MLIQIKNYKNLRNLSYSIDDNKVNFLFGMSGSGKSSILDAICNDDQQSGKTIGTTDLENLVVEVDGGKINPSDAHVFNVNQMNIMLNESTVETFKEVVLVNNQEHINIHADLENKISLLHKAVSSEKPIYENYDKMLGELKAKKLTKKNTISPTSPFSKVLTKLEALKESKFFKELKAMNESLLEWKITGASLIIDNKCPFCDKVMSKARINKINRMSQFDAKNIGTVKNSINNNSSLIGISVANSLSDLRKIQKKLIKISKAVNDFEKVEQQFNDVFDLSYDYTKFKRIIFSKSFKDLFPNTYSEYNKVCNKMRSLKNAIKKTQIKTDAFLKGKKKIVNDIFDKMGIPYLFSVKYSRSGPNEYSIIHKNDKENNDDKKRLSEGEKALVCLVLFLISSNSLNYKVFFIDDPVSSYDTYRRKLIFDLILKYLKNKTTIVLSHDSIFAKFAIEEFKKGNSDIGSVSYLSNNGQNAAIIQTIQNISVESFSKSVCRRFLNASGEYEKAILARLLLEENYENSPLYTYLSAILHGEPYSKIQRWISRQGTDEVTIIGEINNELVKFGLTTNLLVPLTISYNSNIDISNFSVFEKSIVLRELANRNKKSYAPYIVSELNNNVHLNETLAIGMDVFSFPIISRTLLDAINNMPTTISLN